MNRWGPFRKHKHQKPDDLERRTGYALANALRPKRNGFLYEQLLVVGLPASIDTSNFNRNPKGPMTVVSPEVLYRYPKEISGSPLEYVAHFCFPVGVEVTAVERTKSASSYNELRFGQLATVEQTQNSFIFLITGQEHLLYGVCVINTELINECPSFIGQSIGPTTRNVVELFAPRCYCIISRFPFFRLHLEVLYSIIARERLFKLLHDVDMEGGGGAAIASDVHSADDIIRAYHEKQCPTETDNLTFHLPGELRSIEFVCPPGDEDKQLADWGILTQLQLLSMENVVTLFKAVMLEKQIVIVSSNPGLLSAVVLSIIPIFRPYVFQGPFIPILPVVLYEYLEAPVPYIIGLLRLPEENSQNSVLSDKIVVDIDNNTIKLPTSKDFLFPKLPREKKNF